MKLKPSLHKPVPMGAKVKVPEHYIGKSVTGRVAGIASMHVVFSYIVILDEQIMVDGESWEAINVHGPELEGVDGNNWRLDNS